MICYETERFSSSQALHHEFFQANSFSENLEEDDMTIVESKSSVEKNIEDLKKYYFLQSKYYIVILGDRAKKYYDFKPFTFPHGIA